jgi:hypothetical protein
VFTNLNKVSKLELATAELACKFTRIDAVPVRVGEISLTVEARGTLRLTLDGSAAPVYTSENRGLSRVAALVEDD